MSHGSATIQLCTLQETAEQLRKSENQLRWMMHRNAAPRSAIIGGRRMFMQSDITAFIREQFGDSADAEAS